MLCQVRCGTPEPTVGAGHPCIIIFSMEAGLSRVVISFCVLPMTCACSWSEFTAGWLVGGLSGVAWAYILTQTLPYYS
jgi:hypothetical protein